MIQRRFVCVVRREVVRAAVFFFKIPLPASFAKWDWTVSKRFVALFFSFSWSA